MLAAEVGPLQSKRLPLRELWCVPSGLPRTLVVAEEEDGGDNFFSKVPLKSVKF